MRLFSVFLLTLVIFTAGVITGTLATRTHIQTAQAAVQTNAPPRGFPALPLRPQQQLEFLHRLDRELTLSTNQYARIEAAILTSQDHMQKLLEPIRPKAEEEARDVRQKILAELDPSQQKRFHEILKNRRRENGQRKQHQESRATNSTGELH